LKINPLLAQNIYLIFMSIAKTGDTVKVNYKGTLNDGTLFDSSEGREPLEFTLGSGQMIPGFEKNVLGMNIGEVKTAVIACDEAYGQPTEELFMPVPIDQVPADIKPEIGMQLMISRPDGQQMPVSVIQVTEEQIVLDANHPLAGDDLTFEIELLSIN
jgi:FKBP-type peptidyl-prolyl cis-trans isomerase 2